MKIIIILLYALANQVTSQTNVTNIFPARILAQQKTISENSDLYLTCSTFGFKRQIMVSVHLCKDDLWVDKKMQKQNQNDTTFTMHRVGLKDSGNYSCVYSLRDNLPPKVAKRGHNVIEILVISNFLPADISVAGPSTVSEGDNVALRCTLSDTLQTLGECQLIHSYLRRNDNILQVQAFNVTRMEANFTIEGAVMRDSGHYSCVVLPSKCIQEHEKTLYGNNAVVLRVKENVILMVILSCGLIIVMFLLGLCLWWINKQARYTVSKSCEASRQADMVEEQQVQAEDRAQDVVTFSGDSFSMEPDEDYQNADAEDLSHSDDYEGVYSNADEGDHQYDDFDPMCVNSF